MFQSQNLSQKILLALSGVGFLAVAGWYLMESSISPNESNRANQRPANNQELDSLPPGLSDTPLKTQPLGTVKPPSNPLGLPKGNQTKPKIPGISSSPNLNLNLPSSTSSIPTTPLNIPSSNFSSLNTTPNFSPIPAQPKGSLFTPSFSQPSIPRKSAKPQNTDGPGSLLPQLPDPLDRAEPIPSQPSPSVKPSGPNATPAKPPQVAPDTALTSPPVSSYAPASDSLQISPSEFSDPVPLTPSSESKPPELPPADSGVSTPQTPQTQPQ